MVERYHLRWNVRRIPQDIQLGLLKRVVNDDAIKKIGKKLDAFEAVGLAAQEIHIMSSGDEKASDITYDLSGDLVDEYSFRIATDEAYNISRFFSFVGIGLPFFLWQLRPSIKERRRKTTDYVTKRNGILGNHEKTLESLVRPIRVYQGSIDEVSAETGRKLERVEVEGSHTFIRTNEEYGETFWLRVRAALLGADAIVHYQPGSSIGTPVRYVNKE